MSRFMHLKSLIRSFTTRGTKFLTTLVKCNINQVLNVCSEALVDEPTFPERELAASVASKVFYYLEAYDEALRLALQAGDKFDLNEKSQYVNTLIHQCIDKYIEQRIAIYDKKEEVKIDANMEKVVNRMLDRCFADQ